MIRDKENSETGTSCEDICEILQTAFRVVRDMRGIDDTNKTTKNLTTGDLKIASELLNLSLGNINVTSVDRPADTTELSEKLSGVSNDVIKGVYPPLADFVKTLVRKSDIGLIELDQNVKNLMTALREFSKAKGEIPLTDNPPNLGSEEFSVNRLIEFLTNGSRVKDGQSLVLSVPDLMEALVDMRGFTFRALLTLYEENPFNKGFFDKLSKGDTQSLSDPLKEALSLFNRSPWSDGNTEDPTLYMPGPAGALRILSVSNDLNSNISLNNAHYTYDDKDKRPTNDVPVLDRAGIANVLSKSREIYEFDIPISDLPQVLMVRDAGIRKVLKENLRLSDSQRAEYILYSREYFMNVVKLITTVNDATLSLCEDMLLYARLSISIWEEE